MRCADGENHPLGLLLFWDTDRSAWVAERLLLLNFNPEKIAWVLF